MTTCDREVVVLLSDAITQRIGEPRYRLWFDQKTKLQWAADRLEVGVPNMFYQEWLQKKFGEMVQAAAEDVFGRAMQVCFVIDAELFQAARKEQADCEDKPAVVPAAASEPKPSRMPKRTRRWRLLKDFVVGPCNRLAYASALSIIEAPGQHANPLVIHGPVGTGKTHLLEAVYAGLKKEHAEWRICYVTSEDFTNRFVHAMHQGKLAAFRKHFRECDGLLIDDIQFLANKKATQEEFLHTFDVLQGEGKQVVATTDCHPRLADELTPELSDRLLGGAVWGITPPEEQTRREMLRAKCAGLPHPVPDDVICFLAGQLKGNVRELEGALHSVQHYSSVTNGRITMQLAREALGDVLRYSVHVVKLADVEQAVCQVLRLPSGALQQKQRSWMVSHPRMVAIYLTRKHTGASYTEIGRHFGGRNHSTAVAAEKKVRGWLEKDEQLQLGENKVRVREIVERVERELSR